MSIYTTGQAAGQEFIKSLRAGLGRPIKTLLALAANNDPYYADTPARREMAEWFAGLRHQFGFGPGTHLRRIHYVLISQTAPIQLPDSKQYQNTENC
jgi:hypothetical protein